MKWKIRRKDKQWELYSPRGVVVAICDDRHFTWETTIHTLCAIIRERLGTNR